MKNIFEKFAENGWVGASFIGEGRTMKTFFENVAKNEHVDSSFIGEGQKKSVS